MIKPITATEDITINQGDDFIFQLRLKSGDEPIDLTGNEYVCRVKESAKSDHVIIEAVAELIAPTDGLVEFHFRDEETKLIKANGNNYSMTSKYTYDVIERTPQGVVTRLLQGMLYVSPGVSYK